MAIAVAVTPAWAQSLIAAASAICIQSPGAASFDASSNSATPDDPVGSDDCASLCLKWVATCKGSVAAVKRCWLSVIGKYTGLRNAVCNTNPATKEACKATLKAERDALKKSLLPADTQVGFDFCAGPGLANCLTHCS